MALYYLKNFEEVKLALWRIEEDTTFFEKLFPPQTDILNEGKRLQWYATRHLVNEVLGKPVEVLKDRNGKPYLPNNTPNISLTHTPQFAGVMLSEAHEVGIDLEPVNPKVERIAPKFLRADEIESINPEEKIERLILYWSAKEAMYKLHGRRQLEFKTQLLIEPFEMANSGKLTARIIADDYPTHPLEINYEFFEGHVLTYTVAGK